jgi:chromate transporter
VGPDAAMLNMQPEEFSNLMALTQMTPGPVSLNASTFFGYSMNGVVGAVVASAALLMPSYFMMTAVLVGLDRWRKSPVVRSLLILLKPVSVLLMAVALWKFSSLSVWGCDADDGFVFRPIALSLAVFSAVMLVKRRLSIMALIFLCAVIGALSCNCVV